MQPSGAISAICAAAAGALEPRRGPVQITPGAALGGSSRSTVLRCTVRSGDGRETPAVLKASLGPGEGPIREEAAMRLADTHGLPSAVRLLAASADPAVLVLADAGSGATLADRLLGDDPAAAEHALVGWAQALGELQAATTGLRPAFEDELTRASPFGAPPADTAPGLLADAAGTLARALPLLGVRPSRRALTELREVVDALDVSGTGAPGGLAPGDTCPDNAVETDNGFVLLDFEGATHRHIAWEAAYLTVPWPSCWCSWRLPPSVTGAAIEAWRSTVEPQLPVVAEPVFDDDLARATIAWAFVSSGWLLDAALDGDPPPADPARRELMPTRQQMVGHRWRTAAELETAVLPALRELAAETHAASVAMWGRQSLALAPAFR